MAGKTEKDETGMIQKLLDKGDEFSFFQAVRLLIRNGLNISGIDPDIRVRPGLDFTSRSQDIRTIEKNKETGTYDIITAFMGLYGVNSPLPGFYTNDLIKDEQAGQTDTRVLLDIVHQRFYDLFYQAESKERPLVGIVEGQDKQILNLLSALCGQLPETENNREPFLNRLNYIDLFSTRTRSALGLETLLTDAYDGIPVQVLQCVKRKARIPRNQRLSLGQTSHPLGDGTVLGETIEDSMGKIRIILGPVSSMAFENLMGKKDPWKELIVRIKSYVLSPVECELNLVLDNKAVPTSQLGMGSHSCLGISTWIFSNTPTDNLTAVIRLNIA